MSSSRRYGGGVIALSALAVVLTTTGGCRGDDTLAVGCGYWNPRLVAQPVADHESRAIHVSWSGALPSVCLGSAASDLDHVELHRSTGVILETGECSAGDADVPQSPGAETLVMELTTAGTTITDEIELPGRAFAYAVFGCWDEDCSSWFGDGTIDGENVEQGMARVCTEPEQWSLVNIGGQRDTDVHALWDPSQLFDFEAANSAEIFMIPDDWKDAEVAGHVAMYYSVSGSQSASGVSEIFVQVAAVAGWPDRGFNCDHREPCPGEVTCCTGDGGDLWHPAQMALQGSADELADDYSVDHPWVMLTEAAGEQRVELFAHSNHDPEDQSLRIVRVSSDDGDLTEFGLQCNDAGWCYERTFLDGNDAGVMIHPDGSAAYGHIEHARHGRIHHDYLADPFVRRDGPCAEAWLPGCPVMLWMSDMQDDDPDGACYQETKEADDITLSPGSWDDLGGYWTWPILDVDGDTCADLVLQDRRDPAVIPLGGERFKVYVHGSEDEPITVATWDGEAFSADVPIELLWDSPVNEGGPDFKCIDNVATFAAEIDGAVREGMVVRIHDSDSGCGVGLDDDNGEASGDGRLVFAQHVN